MMIFIWSLRVILYITVAILLVYMIRHYAFTLARVFTPAREAYQEWTGMVSPKVTVLVPMHNEERVCLGALQALERSSFDKSKLQVIPVNDRSTDRTRELVDEFAKDHPWCQPFHRTEGVGGKPAALADAMKFVTGDIILIFDADYTPGLGLLEYLIAPFGDPEIGLVMGRVVPSNVGANILTRTLDLERSGGYQVNQQARWRLGLVPQFGGTVGGIRRSALDAAGGWDRFILAEDTDLTFRLLALGWKVAYVNRAECYEEVVETWAARHKQVKRWAMGHMQAALRHTGTLFHNPHLSLWEKVDAFLLLFIYFVPVVTLVGWLSSILIVMLRPDDFLASATRLLAALAFSAIGSLATFFEIGIAVALDGGHRRMRLLPFCLANFMASLLIVNQAFFQVMWSIIRRRQHIAWDKTPRFRKAQS
jgi:cellulose synthase/poly-beta-1,6-N-acetylglucosamine synthase-like glycosyltransferase